MSNSRIAYNRGKKVPLPIANTLQTTLIDSSINQASISIEALLGLVSWLKQIKKQASETERGTAYASSNETTNKTVAGSKFTGSNKPTVDRTSKPGKRITTKPAEQDFSQTTRPLKTNKGGNKCHKRK
ncbi:MAG: hypothetical protein AB1489_25520 [Acidobacteriota bacterium]